jgi:NIMA (never in mitosis gene a)-related kinase 2
VYKVRRKSDGKILVSKEMDYGKMSEKEKKQIVAEVNILRDLTHQNIVKYDDRFIDKKKQIIYVIMELCSGGDLQKLIAARKKEERPFKESFIWKIFSQIVSGLYHCHRRPDLTQVVHESPQDDVRA